MEHVSNVEELGDGSIDVLPGLVHGVSAIGYLRIIHEIKGHGLPAVRAIIVYPIIGTLPILVRKHLRVDG